MELCSDCGGRVAVQGVGQPGGIPGPVPDRLSRLAHRITERSPGQKLLIKGLREVGSGTVAHLPEGPNKCTRPSSKELQCPAAELGIQWRLAVGSAGVHEDQRSE